MNDFDILQALDPHVVIECMNPESLLYVPSIEDEVEEAMEASDKVKTQKWYPVYIFVCHTGTLLSSLIQLWTKDQYSHSLISFDASMTQMYSFGRKKLNDDIPIIGASNGFAVDDINNDFYTKWKKNIKYATFVIFVTKKQRAAMIKKVKFFIENQVKFTYDMAGLFAYAAHLPHEKQWSYFCSGFVADVLQTGEVWVRRDPTLLIVLKILLSFLWPIRSMRVMISLSIEKVRQKQKSNQPGISS